MRPLFRTLAILLACASPTACGPQADAQTTRPASGEEIARLVAGLANRSYQKREQITRRIAEVGPAAIPYLRREISNPKQEIALAARELMRELEDVLFAGVAVRLEVDPPRARWDQPVRLRVVAENRSPFEAKIPWKTKTTPTTRPASLASSVGEMLDVGDFLEVTSPGDEPIDLRVDSIGDDHGVEIVVNERAAGGPVSMLAPGEKCMIDLPEFNRGWVRYPLLAKGRYRVQFVYQPEWSRSEWIEAGLGKVVGNAVEIEVVEPAPPVIRKATQPLKVLITRDQEGFVASMVSTWDRPFCVNLNFGSDTTQYAQLGWSVAPGKGEAVTVNYPPADGAAPAPLNPDRLRRLQPGEKAEIARIDAAALRAAATKQAPNAEADGWHVSVRYANQVTREDVRRIAEKAEKGPNALLRKWADKNPYPLLTGAPDSRPIPLAPPATTSRPAKPRT